LIGKEIVVIGRFGKSVSLVVVCTLLAWGLARAAISKYQQKRQEILAACKVEREKMGIKDISQIRAKCPTPEIRLVAPTKVSPGDQAEVTVTGKFPEGTRFLFGSDNIEIVKESTAANSYRASIKVAANGGPESIFLEALTPVCCVSTRREASLVIGGKFNWDLKADNGWRIKGSADVPPGGSGSSAELKYMLEFYRGNETAPFAKRRATVFPSGGSGTPSYNFSISQEDEANMSAQAEYERLAREIANPNLTDAQREKLMQQLQATMQKMTEQMGRMGDPAYLKKLQAQQEEFGCTSLNVSMQNGILTGSLQCSQKVGRNIPVNGNLKYLGK
jgi:hypothetical protein